MKQLIFILLSIAVFVGCQDSSVVEPNSDYSDQINKFEEDPFILPILDGYGEAKEVHVDYYFNPCLKDCGEMLYGTCLDYRYDDAITNSVVLRYIENAKFYVPSKMMVDGKSIDTYNLYTLNRTEKVGTNQYGKILGGETWGTFQVIVATGHHPLDYHYSPTVLFEGKFSGDIKENITNIKLVGKGCGYLIGRDFIASEIQVCEMANGKLNCFSSEINGKVGPKLKVEE